MVLSEAGKDLEAVRMELDGMLGATRSGDVEVEQGAEGAGAGGSSKEVKAEEEMTSSAETLKQTKPDGNGNAVAEGTKEKEPKKQTMLALLSLKAQAYIDELDRDLEKVENKAGSYLTKVGTGLGAYLKEAVNIEGPSSARGIAAGAGASGGAGAGATGEGEVLFNVPEDIRNQIYSTRLEAQLHALHTSPEPFLVSTSSTATAAAEEDPEYAAFASTFDANAHTSRIASDLATYPKLRGLMEQLVPAQVRYDEFWRKYYYMRHQIAAQEEKRKKLMERATAQAAAGAAGGKRGAGEGEDGKEEFDWDEDSDEDEDDEDDKKKVAKEVEGGKKEKVAEELASPKSVKSNTTAPGSSRPSSEASYDLVSQSASTIDLPSKGAAAAAAAGAKGAVPEKTAGALAPTAAPQAKPVAVPAAAEDSESDDDWE